VSDEREKPPVPPTPIWRGVEDMLRDIKKVKEEAASVKVDSYETMFQFISLVAGIEEAALRLAVSRVPTGASATNFIVMGEATDFARHLRARLGLPADPAKPAEGH